MLYYMNCMYRTHVFFFKKKIHGILIYFLNIQTNKKEGKGINLLSPFL